ncbi:hypothetical protein [Xanthocytophaga agilis]|uniref:Uncharacterized protein n=1 Tax=Xanthocytophaga agilis TaxID=3048010 RepID=A0AAE3REL7_9BACT|nr:hypothetical protein [Xanthocytophaga agilis]MDJ1506768.1 hypothetical protein [Xanthocytophaga agilis]
MEKKKKADILLERILLMIDVSSEVKNWHISVTLHRKEIAQDAYNKKNTIGLGMLQRQLLGSWEECENPKLKQALFDEYKKRTGRNATQDIRGNKSILAKIAKRKKIVNDMEYDIVNDYLSDNIEDYEKQKEEVTQWNLLLSQYTVYSEYKK